jgi:predicted neutral ceramidase superfamily lipid hydrolase
VTNRTELVQRAAKSARRLRLLNVATLCVAVVVYLGLVVIALFEDVAPLILFSSCIMLAELLVFQIVRTLSDHLDLMR